MDSKARIRKIEVKKVGSAEWRWTATEEMTIDEAIAKAAEVVKKDEAIYAIRIARMATNSWAWVEEFSGDRNFEYIGASF